MTAPTQSQTPGVYVTELDAFPGSVVEVPTSIPVFIGYTEVALDGNKDLSNLAMPISSLAEFVQYYGSAAAGYNNGAPQPRFAYVSHATQTPPYEQSPADLRFCLFYSVQLFFNNGGGSCYIMSIGSYARANLNGPSQSDYATAWQNLPQCLEPSIVVLPDAVLLNYDDWKTVSLAALQHCATMQSGVAILDVWNGYTPADGTSTDPISGGNGTGGFYAVGAMGDDRNQYGVAYYPWLHTNIVSDSAIDYTWLTPASLPQLAADLKAEAPVLFPGTPAGQAQLKNYTDVLLPQLTAALSPATTHRTLCTLSPLYRQAMANITTSVNLLPPSGAMAGVYARNDNTMGVWHAPANMGITSAIAPSVVISDSDQAALNTPLNGIAVNAIRAFPERGLLVWGARTMAGNSNDWRYISVRRTVIMLEQSIKMAMQAYVFQPNTSQTWAAVNGSISNFLNSQWKAGALVGAKPSDAYSVSVGLGSTMTGEDILQGFMNVAVQVALVRPAEFIELTFQQQMQTS